MSKRKCAWCGKAKTLHDGVNTHTFAEKVTTADERKISTLTAELKEATEDASGWKGIAEAHQTGLAVAYERLATASSQLTTARKDAQRLAEALEYLGGYGNDGYVEECKRKRDAALDAHRLLEGK